VSCDFPICSYIHEYIYAYVHKCINAYMHAYIHAQTLEGSSSLWLVATSIKIFHLML